MRYLVPWAFAALSVAVVEATRHDWFSPTVPANLFWIVAWAVIGLLWWQAGKATDWWRQRGDEGARAG